MEKKGNGNGKRSNGRKGEGRRNIHVKDKKVGGRRGRGWVQRVGEVGRI